MPDDDNFGVVENMKSLDQSQKDVQGRMITTTQNTGICFTTPKESRFIGCWNVRTMYSIGKAAQVAREMRQNHCEIFGISEVRWTSFGKIELENPLYFLEEKTTYIEQEWD